jgi:hypothetical protein
VHLPGTTIKYKPECDFGKHKPYQADPQEGLYLEELLMLLSSHMPNALSQPPIKGLRCKWNNIALPRQFMVNQ